MRIVWVIVLLIEWGWLILVLEICYENLIDFCLVCCFSVNVVEDWEGGVGGFCCLIEVFFFFVGGILGIIVMEIYFFEI